MKGRLILTYTNNSPDSLSYLWFTNIQNRYRKDSREAIMTQPKFSRFGIVENTEGLVIEELSINKTAATWLKHDNYFRVNLDKALMPGKQVQVELTYRQTLPINGSDYMGILKTPNGQVFQYTAIFPRVCVYDDLNGWSAWHTQYYVECGSMDMHFTAPANMLVNGTGALMNPEEVLRPSVLKRYRDAVKSDSIIKIRNAGEPFAREGANTLTWHFFEPRAGDGIWAASAAYKWEDARSPEIRKNRPGHDALSSRQPVRLGYDWPQHAGNAQSI